MIEVVYVIIKFSPFKTPLISTFNKGDKTPLIRIFIILKTIRIFLCVGEIFGRSVTVNMG